MMRDQGPAQHDHGGFLVSQGARPSVIMNRGQRPGPFHDRGGFERQWDSTSRYSKKPGHGPEHGSRQIR